VLNILFIFNSLPLFSIVNSEVKEVPMHLDSVFRTEGWVLGMMLFLSFLLLALGKRLEPRILEISFKSFFTLGTPDSLQKFEVRFSSTGFVLLAFNFMISLWVCFTLFVQHIGSIESTQWMVLGYELTSLELALSTLIIIIFLIVYNFLGLFITLWLTGENNLMRIFLTQSWVNILFFGYFFFALGVIWLLNPSASNYFFDAFKYLFIAFYVIRFFKTIIASLLEGVSWYYIILYLCTLEILPIIVLVHYTIGF
jgi:hypothetical protein